MQKIETVQALLLIVFGLFKKMVLANYLGVEVVDPVFEAPQNLSALDALFGAYAYAIYIYCDFSAYSDMAIGFAELLGIKFPRNFDQPYRSQSLQEFWRRWHISLSSWLRDYLFVPLGGSREGQGKTYRNLMVTMLIGGIWHGASWTFVVWGLLHGTGLAGERWYRDKFGDACECIWSKLFATLWVFHFVCLAWIFFRCETFEKAFHYLSAFSSLSQPSRFITPFAVTLVALGGALNFAPRIVFEALEEVFSLTPKPVLGVVFGLFLVCLSALSPEEIPPFIYFRF
jgi:D-alanyl-lipoteichoic acid acyltransferase DltB (MBOAT superfamily)